MSANFVDLMLIDADTSLSFSTIFPESRADARHCRGDRRAAARAALVARPVSGAAADARRSARSVCLAALSGTVVRRADGPREGVRSRRLCVAVRALRRARAGRSGDPRPSANRTPASRPPCAGGNRRLQARHSGCRTSSWCSTSSSFDISAVPGVKVPPDYQSHFRSFDGKAAHLPRRRRRRPDLVHRIQRAERPVGALLRPLRRFRHADRRRPRHAQPAERAAQLRLSHLQRLSLARRVSRARAISRRRSASSISTTPRISKPATSSRTSSTTPSPPIC